MSALQRAPRHGSGKARVHAFGAHAHFSELSYTYPLKMLSPNIPFAGDGVLPVGVAYVLSYGGGLVSGDRIELQIDIEQGAGALFLTQGSTKVFKSRFGADRHRLSAIVSASTTAQHITATLSPSSLLVLLPDPVTCFQHASYNQIQTFRLAPSSSLVLLDWFTSGRMARGEEWEFERYYSRNEVWVGGTRIARDVMLLERAETSLSGSHGLPPRTLKDRLDPYACYATLFLLGPLVQPVIQSLRAPYSEISQRQRAEPDDLIWSQSPLSEGDGLCVRVAGKETELVREWLRVGLVGLESVIGHDVYTKAFV